MKADFSQLLSQIRRTNDHFHRHTVKSIDKLLTIRNWLIGAYIFEYEQNGNDKAKYGSKLEEHLADRINQKGLSSRNLKLFKQFYIIYPEIVQTLSTVSELPKETMQTLSASFKIEVKSKIIDYSIRLIENLSFSHFVELLKLDNNDQRHFYEIQTIRSALSVRELKRQIGSLTYERTGRAHNKGKVLDIIQTEVETQSPTDILKTPYIFDFLGLSDDTLASESDLENALISNLK